MNSTVVGIDVGGEKRGFHAVALRDGRFFDKTTNLNPTAIVTWCLNHQAKAVAVDAPCRWSKDGSSRAAERELFRHRISCFASPTKQRALQRDFYKWMLNGERLYECLESRQYLRFDGEPIGGPVSIETFPHAIVCAMAGQVVRAKHKAKSRRDALQSRGYDASDLSNVDLLDAGLCAIAADEFLKNNYRKFGNREDGFVIVPAVSTLFSTNDLGLG